MHRILKPFFASLIGASSSFGVSLGEFNSGVLSRDAFTGTGYMLFNPEGLTHRVSTLGDWGAKGATHFITVQWEGGSWYYFANDHRYPFVPERNDVIVAILDFGGDTVDHLDGENYFYRGIQCGYASGDLVVTSDSWNGAENNGEFGVAGNTINLHPTTQRVSLGALGKGVAAPDDAQGGGYLLFAPSGLVDRVYRHPDQSSNFVAVYFQDGQWFHFQNEETYPFQPLPDDVLVAELDYETEEVTSLQGQNQLIHGVLAGYADGDLVVTGDQFSGVFNEAEFGLSGTFITYNSPYWWVSQNVLDPTSTDFSAKGVANVGQAKWMALGALNTIQQQNPELAAAIQADLVGDPATHPFSGWPPPGSGEGDKTALALGQLKAIVAPFYHHLNAKAPRWLENEMRAAHTRQEGTYLPWSEGLGESENRAAANIGQLKAVFSLRLSTLADGVDADSDGLPDRWEKELMIASGGRVTSLHEITPEGDFDWDHLSNRLEYLRSLEPATPSGNQILFPVNWRNEERAVFNEPASNYGSSLYRLGGGWIWDAGAVSEKLMTGDGGIRFRFNIEAGSGAYCGLSALSSGSHYVDLDYAFQCARGCLFIRESGSNRASLGAITSATELEIRRVGTTVQYFVNNGRVWTSSKIADRPLFADSSLNGHPASAITHSGHYGFSDGDLDQDTLPDYWELSHAPNLSILSPESDHDRDFYSSIGEFRQQSDPFSPNDDSQIPMPIEWENLDKVSAGVDLETMSSSLTRTVGQWWNAGASSVGRIEGDGSLLIRASEVRTARCIGLSIDNGLPEDNPDSGRDSIDFAFIYASYSARRYENGVKKSHFSISPNDTLEIRRVGDTITYHINGFLKATSAVKTTLPLFIDSSIFSSGTKIDHIAATGLRDSSPDTDGDGLGDWLESLAGIDPGVTDSDGDGISDGEEVFTYRSNPLSLDSDGDGLPDSWEFEHGLDLFNPTQLTADSDADGLPDAIEFRIGSDPRDSDTDDDYVPDGIEYYGL